MERLRAIQVVDSFFVPRPLQEATLELVGAPAWPRHLRTIAAGCVSAAKPCSPHSTRNCPGSPLPSGRPPAATTCGSACPTAPTRQRLTAACLRAGVAVSPGRPYFAAEAPAPHIRISFADTVGTDEIAEGVHRIATVCADTGVTASC